jgi:hypothetical protein
MSTRVRHATAADSETVIAVVRECWTHYPGVIFDLDGELPELKHFAGHYRALGGEAWVAELDGAIAGCIAITPEEDEPGVWMPPWSAKPRPPPAPPARCEWCCGPTPDSSNPTSYTPRWAMRKYRRRAR